MHDHVHGFRRWIPLGLGMLVTGLVCAQAVRFMTSPRGAPGPTALQAELPWMATMAVLGAFAIGTAAAAIVGRLVNAVVGLFVLGWGMGVLAMQADTIHEVAFGSAAPALLVAETVLYSAISLAAAILVFRVSGPLPDVEPDLYGHHPHPLRSAAALKAAAAGLLILPATWLIAQTPFKGQALGATFIGGMTAGLTARLLAPHVQPVLIFGSTILAGAVGQLIGLALTRETLAEALVSGSASPLLIPMPIDVAAGSIAGAAMGIGWARSFLHHEQQPQTTPRVAAGQP